MNYYDTMSMSQSVHVAVISHRFSVKTKHDSGGELASMVAAILRGRQNAQDTGVHPYIIPTALGTCRLSLRQYGISMGYSIDEPIPPWLLDPDTIHLWLALDKEGEELAQKRIQEFDSKFRSTLQPTARNDFFRQVFPNPVVNCGFAVPDPPSDSDFQDWFNFLIILFAAWELRIWKFFSDSS